MIDYSKLRPCQVVICAGRGWFAKLWAWIISGFKAWPDNAEPVYVGMVYDVRGEFLVAHMPNKKGIKLSSFAEFMTKRRWVVDIVDTPTLNYADREGIQRAIAKEFRYMLSKTGEHKDKGVTATANSFAKNTNVAFDEIFIDSLLKRYSTNHGAGIPSYTEWASVDGWGNS